MRHIRAPRSGIERRPLRAKRPKAAWVLKSFMVVQPPDRRFIKRGSAESTVEPIVVIQRGVDSAVGGPLSSSRPQTPTKQQTRKAGSAQQ